MAPGERVANVPAPVSAIIMKLLAKTGEDRYQTAAGLERDLRHCLAQWHAERRIDDFPLGEHDIPDRLLIPETLYGRAHDVETLLAAFDRVVHGGAPELVLVSGYSGIGKSSVVHELHKVLVPPRALFAAGKFDQHKRDIPYSTLAQAFQRLIRPLLTKSDDELGRWRDALHEALGPNGQLMVDLVPDLKVIVGDQPVVPELPPQDAQRRFQLVFRRFLGVFAQPEHPLALFLDDLQWLDVATLDLLQDLMIQGDVRDLLLIGAYRDNEVTAAHPLMRRLEAIRGMDAPVQEITLAPLGRDDVCRLIEDSLYCDAGRAAPLAQLVHEKSAGNPFFAIQFLSTLIDEGLVTFDHPGTRWRWDLPRIHAKGHTDNVIDLLVGKLRRLPTDTQRALRHLACLGNSADAAVLAMVYEDSKQELDRGLQHAQQSGLVFQSEGAYRFIHDRVQEAVYSLIPEAQRAGVHLRIGKLLAARTPPEKREEAIFEIVNQLNRGAPLITSREEREQLAELNLAAGKRAKGSSAYVSAMAYLTAGAAMLPEDAWERRQELAFELALHQADCEVCMGALPAAEERLATLAPRAADRIQRCAVARRRVELYTMLGAGERAVTVTLECLGQMGIEWSPHPTEVEARAEYERFWSRLGSRAIENLVDLPLLQDPEAQATLGVLTSLVVPALYTDLNLYALSVCRASNLSLERGNSDAAAFNYAAMGMIAGPRFGHYERGDRLGKMACDLCERHGWNFLAGRTDFTFATLVPWTRPLADGIDPARRAFQKAKDHGDPAFAAVAARALSSILLAVGHPLDQVEREVEHGLAYVRRFGFFLDRLSAPLALVRTLRGRTAKFGALDDGAFTERSFEERMTGEPARVFLEGYYWIRKLQARFFAGDYPSAVEAADRAARWYETSAALGLFPTEMEDFHFYAALAFAAACDPMSPDSYAEHREALQRHEQELRASAANCPQNFENRAVLIGAEIARLEGRALEAERLYEAAIQSARENGFVQNEALAYELAARFYAGRGFGKIARAYLRDARDGYRQWGAEGKVRQLEGQYPDLADAAPSVDPTRTVVTPVEHLDLSTVLQLSQAVQGETDLEKVITAIMRLAVEHAGAARGLLILPQGEAYRIEAEARSRHDRVTVELQSARIGAEALPPSVLQYVLRTHQRVCLRDAAVADEWADDAYVRRHHARSLLCIPLLKQTRLAGILYLENNLTAGAFTPTRMALLEVLAADAAISLENARLYHDVQEHERESRLIVETIPGFVASLSPAGEVEFVNKGLMEYCGQGLDAMKQWGTNGTVHVDDLPHVVELFTRGITSGEPYEFDARIRRSDGTYRWFQVRGLPLRDMGGQIVRWYSLLVDIDGRKRAETELTALKDQLYKENLVLRDEVDRTSMFEEIVGTSPALQPVLGRVAKVAPTDSTVLITGETGTGKELVARAIHRRSARGSRTFVSVNCAAVPRELIASELFGHEKGAFTGATQRRLGRFELAHGGTLFLDEVGELPMETQVALLRVLQERAFERVGGSAAVRVDVRVVAATNRDLEAVIEAGTFRRDLFYRLNVFPIAVPPLRERVDDIPLLVEYFIDRYARQAGKRIRRVNTRTLERLRAYPWPGNVRELQNVVERSVIVCETDEFTVDESWLAPASAGDRRVLASTLAGHERALIEDALRASGGRVYGPGGAAARLGVARSTLESKIRGLGIDKTRFRARRTKP
jgi:PAS domain S-box-containing protein